MEKYAAALADPAAAACVSYLASRGIQVGPDSNPWQFGYVAEPDAGHEDMRGRLALPYLVPRGGPVGMKFRCSELHDCAERGHAKYLSQPGMGKRLFGVRSFRTDSMTFGVTEGEFDAIVASEAGIPSVAVPGVAGWQEPWRYLFEGFHTVLIFGDGDDPGRKFADRLVNEVPNAQAVHMPAGHDVSSYVEAHGADALRERAGIE